MIVFSEFFSDVLIFKKSCREQAILEGNNVIVTQRHNHPLSPVEIVQLKLI